MSGDDTGEAQQGTRGADAATVEARTSRSSSAQAQTVGGGVVAAQSQGIAHVTEAPTREGEGAASDAAEIKEEEPMSGLWQGVVMGCIVTACASVIIVVVSRWWQSRHRAPIWSCEVCGAPATDLLRDLLPEKFPSVSCEVGDIRGRCDKHPFYPRGASEGGQG